ncbi:vacuolar protein sorting-associated protein 9A-like [Phragmites australis]|uniref:vacuolar protein sorting-associated protein 9A-like n=1 Tax=Phragmites australis TaxID=29695 RepID=UPI002D79546E|nr:vacuolar protein sorting-associated protein 9A-like [Phragmites australis]
MEGGGDAFGSSTAPLAWHDFLERMRQPSAADFVKSIKGFIVTFSNRAPDPEKDSAAVQEFLENMEGAFRAHTPWAGSSEEELESAGEGLEKYVMTKLFNRVFASVPEDVNSDEELFEKMSLIQQFIRPENLDIKPEYQNETSWLLAQKELQKMNMYKAPRDKLACILNCCKVINNLLLNASIVSNENPPGADEFLPVLIYVTIKANPPQLHSNLLYIQRYRRQTRLVSEAQYFFTNILSAESFIWNIDGESLSMNEIDFQRKMNWARERLLGLSADSENQDNQSNLDVQERRSQNLKANRNSDVSLALKDHIQGPGRDMRRDSDVSAKSVERVQSISDLEKKGATELVNDDDLNKKFQEYPFIFARAGDLTVADVENLLNSYKQLVLRYAALLQGMGVSPETTLAQGTRTVSDLSVEPENASFVVKNNENNEGISKTSDDATIENLHSEVVIFNTAGSEQMDEQTAVDSSDDLKVLKDEASHQPENA